MEEDLPLRLAEALDQALRKASIEATPAGDPHHWERERLFELWHFALAHGHVPWWASFDTAVNLPTKLEVALAEVDRVPDSIRTLVAMNHEAALRLVANTSDVLLRRFMFLADPQLNEQAAPLLRVMERLHSTRDAGDSLRAICRFVWVGLVSHACRAPKHAGDERLEVLIRETVQQSARFLGRSTLELADHFFRRAIELATRQNERASIEKWFRRSWPELTSLPVDQSAARRSAPNSGEQEPEIGEASVAGFSEARLPAESDDLAAVRNEASSDASAEPAMGSHDVLPIDSQRSESELSVSVTPALNDRGAPVAPEPPLSDAILPQPPSPPADEPATVSRVFSADPAATEFQGDANPQVADAHVQTQANSKDPGLAHRENGEPASLNGQQTSACSQLDIGDSIYIDDAGLVLLHAFVPRYLGKIGLTHENRFLKARFQENAVLQLRRLAFGHQQAPDYVLALPKLLCGLAVDAVLMQPTVLDESAEVQATKLLSAVIEHWGALKNTSPDGLREAFLQREGRLERTEAEAWRLTVESRSYDLLLDRLPWAIEVIRLPWMSHRLHVQWR